MILYLGRHLFVMKNIETNAHTFQMLKLFSERQPMCGGMAISFFLNQFSLELYNPKMPQCDSHGSWISFQEQVSTQHTVQIVSAINCFISQKVFLLIWVEYNMNMHT